MTHKIRHKQLSNIKKKYKNLAGIVAAATLLSTAVLPGMPTTIAHASANPHSSNMSATTSQKIGKTNDSGMQLNFNSSVASPTKGAQQESKAPQTSFTDNKTSNTNTKPTEQANPNTQPDPNKEPVTATKGVQQANPNTQPDPNKAPVTATKGVQQANPNTQPDPNKVPVTATKGGQQANPNTQPDPNKAPITATKGAQQANPNTQPDPNKVPVTSTNSAQQANPNVQPDPNKVPITGTKSTEQANPQAQPISNVTKPSSSNAPTNYKQVLDIKATAYAPGPHDNDQWGNKTYTGSQVRPGIIAVDPKVIPLGSRVYIEYPDGHGEYVTAEDTGGAIKGNRVDIAKWTVNEAQDFGIQNVKVYVVKTPEKA